MAQIYNMYNICSILYNLYSVSPSFSTILKKEAITIPISFSMPYTYSSYSSNKEEMKNDNTLDYFQIDKLLKWMKLFFDDYTESSDETHKAFKKELYNIYCTINSDYAQYKQLVKYNNSLYLLSSFRSKNTKDLVKKINSDVELFNEGLKMYSLMFNNKD
jgi:hypothetical protein